MKYLFFAIIFCASFALTGQSQYSELDNAVKRMQMQFKLDDGQTATLKDLMIQKNGKLKTLMQTSKNKKTFGGEQMKIMKDFDTSFLAILNEEQKTQYQAMIDMRSPVKKDVGASQLKNKPNINSAKASPQSANQ
ncbi:MAG: hypothetical protein HKN09_07675 [Saprospiraceae bacterium]|nr:hypothetical protein [Saprospiraceae bacterium]